MSSNLSVDAAGNVKAVYAAGTSLWMAGSVTAGGAIVLGDGAKTAGDEHNYTKATVRDVSNNVLDVDSIPTDVLVSTISQGLVRGPDFTLLPTADGTLRGRLSAVTERLMFETPDAPMSDEEILGALGMMSTGQWSTIGEDRSLLDGDDGSGDAFATSPSGLYVPPARGRMYVVAAGQNPDRGMVDPADIGGCADLLADLTGGQKVTAMVLDGGARIVVAVRMPSTIRNGIVHHAVLVDSYNGSTPFYLTSADWQPVCNNTTPGFAEVAFQLRHTAEVGNRTELMRDACAAFAAAIVLDDDRIERMLSTTLDWEIMRDFCAPVPEHEGKGSGTKAENKRDALDTYRASHVDPDHRGTAWGAYSAVDAWAHWGRDVRGGTNRVERIVNETLSLPADDIRRPARTLALCAAGMGGQVSDVDLAAVGRIHMRSRAGSTDAAVTRKSALAGIGRDVVERFGFTLDDRDAAVSIVVPDDISSLVPAPVVDDSKPRRGPGGRFLPRSGQ